MSAAIKRHASGEPVRIGIIGAGAVSDYHHVPGIRLDRRAQFVAACDTSRVLLERRRQWGIDRLTTDPAELCADPDVDAVIIATPNFTHRDIALAAARDGQAHHVRKAAGPQCRRSPLDVPARPAMRAWCT